MIRRPALQFLDAPELSRLLEATFHVDWDLDFGTSDEVLADFSSSASPVHRRALIEDLDRALGDAELDAWVEAHTSLIITDGRSYRAWLQHVRAVVRADLPEAPPS